MPYFYGVYPKNEGLKAFLSLIRYIAEPDAVRFAHITLRGPYERKLEPARLKSLNDRIREDPKVRLIEPIGFFGGEQNTVAINVEIDALRDVWYKPHYPMGLAHITIYDGKSRAESVRVLDMLHHYDWHMQVSVTQLKAIEPKISDKDGFLKLASNIYAAYSKFDQLHLPDLGSVRGMTFSERLSVIAELLSQSQLLRVEALQQARA